MPVIGVYGGSFDPPHIGHALVAHWAVLSGQVDEVWFAPAYKHVFGKQSAPFADRVRLLRHLCSSMGSAFQVTSIEEDLPEPHYTYRTLKAIQRHLDDEFQLRFIMGADTWLQQDKWVHWDDLAAEFNPLVINRADYPVVNPDAPILQNTSSSKIREMMAAGEDISLHVPKVVRTVLRTMGKIP